MNYLVHLNSLDYIIIAVVALSVIISFFRGLLREAISLITWFLAFVIALKFSPDVGHWFQSIIPNPTARNLIAVVLLFVGVLIIGILCNKLAHSLVSASGLGFLDKLLGFVFGLLRGFLFVIIILLIIDASTYQQSNWVAQSELAPYFEKYVQLFKKMMPDEMKRISNFLKGSP